MFAGMCSHVTWHVFSDYRCLVWQQTNNLSHLWQSLKICTCLKWVFRILLSRLKVILTTFTCTFLVRGDVVTALKYNMLFHCSLALCVTKGDCFTWSSSSIKSCQSTLAITYIKFITYQINHKSNCCKCRKNTYVQNNNLPSEFHIISVSIRK